MRRPVETHPPLAVIAARRRLAYDRIALVLAVLALLGLGIVAGVLWRHGAQLDAARDESAHRRDSRDGAQAAAPNPQNRAAIAALDSRIDAIETQLAEIPHRQAAGEADAPGVRRDAGAQGLLEAEQILSLATRQLQLTGNVERALADLQAVEALLAQQLQQTPQAQLRYLPLRKLLARDIERLRALPDANLSAIAAALETVLTDVPQLPLAFERRPQPVAVTSAPSPSPAAAVSTAPPLSGWLAWVPALWQDLWVELRQWVRIERLDATAPALLAPREVFFLRENLRLRLLAARIALLTRDGRSFRHDLVEARSWLNTHFDRRAPTVQASLKTLDEIARLDLLQPPPDLDETLAALRRLQRARDLHR